jgi:hypothetical protein
MSPPGHIEIGTPLSPINANDFNKEISIVFDQFGDS